MRTCGGVRPKPPVPGRLRCTERSSEKTMRIRTRLRKLCAETLIDSLDVQTMVAIAQRVLGNYDLNARTGFPDSIAIPTRDAARQIVEDVAESGHFLTFVSLLMQIQHNGFVGRSYRFPGLQEIHDILLRAGYVFDHEKLQFVEDGGRRKTRNWGVLQSGDVRAFTLLRVDIVGNSQLVRRHPPERIERAYADLRRVVRREVEARNGRLWYWEGDGGLAAFIDEDRNNKAFAAAMQVMTGMFLYNLLDTPLGESLRVRIALHSGLCEYQDRFEEMSGEALNTVSEIEANFTDPDSVTVSDAVCGSLDRLFAARLEQVAEHYGHRFYQYRVRIEVSA